MKRTRNAVVVALIVVLAAILAGCSGDDSAEFRNRYEATIKRLNSANAEIRRSAGSENQTNAQIAAGFRRTAKAFETARNDLSRLEAPQDAADEYAEMLAVLANSVYDLRAAAQAAGADNPAAFRRAVDDMSQSSEEMSATERALRKALGG